MIRRWWDRTDAVEKMQWWILAILTVQLPFAIWLRWYEQLWYLTVLSLEASFGQSITAVIGANARRKIDENGS